MQRDFPLGDVVTNDLKKSITRETTNKFIESFDVSNTISLATNSTNNSVLTFYRRTWVWIFKKLMQL